MKKIIVFLALLIANLCTVKADTVTMVGDDFAHQVSVGQSWTATLNASPTATSGLQCAAWGQLTAQAGALSCLDLAQHQSFSNFDFSEFRMYTPVNCSPSSPQEFAAKIPHAAVPEPATLALLGSGLAGLASLLKKRNRDRDSADN